MAAENTSDRLAALIADAPGGPPVALNVSLRRDLKPEQVAAFLADVGAVAEPGHPPHLLERSKMIHARVPLAKVRALAERAEVFWIDTDTTAPVATLMD